MIICVNILLCTYILKTPAAGHRRPPNNLAKHGQKIGRTSNILAQIDGKLINFDAKWSQNGVWAPSGAKMAPERQERCPGPKVPTHFGGHFRDFGASFSMLFFEAFLEGFFFVSRATLGRHRCQKGSKMNPKWSPKRTWGYPVGSVKTMAGAMFSAHKGVSGRVREATFSTLGLQTYSGGVLGSILVIFFRFWVPFGVHFGFFWA